VQETRAANETMGDGERAARLARRHERCVTEVRDRRHSPAL